MVTSMTIWFSCVLRSSCHVNVLGPQASLDIADTWNDNDNVHATRYCTCDNAKCDSICHLAALAFSCTPMCLLSWSGRGNLFPQPGYAQANGLSPVCVRICLVRFDASTKPLSQ